MSNLATINNNLLADSGIDDINVVVTTGSYSNPAWITALSWIKITGTPTTLSGYGITDAYTQTQVNNLLSGYLLLSGGTMTGQIVLKESSSATDYTKGLKFPDNAFGGGGDSAGLRLYANAGENIVLELYVGNDGGDDSINFRTGVGGTPNNDAVTINGNKIWNAANLPSPQSAITLTTTGTSGAATLVGATLNIPQYQSVLTNPVTGTGTANEITYWTGTSTIGSLSTATYPSLTELSYVKGVTSAIQTQLNGKLSLSGGTMTGAITLPNGVVGIVVGDDATIADRNVANTMYVAGVQNTDRGYINFSETAGNQLGAINGGSLTWRGAAVMTTANISGTTNYIPKFTAANTIGNSIVQDDGRVITITSTDGTGARTTLNDVLTITQLNPNAPYSGFGTGILFRGNTYVGNHVWGRIGMQLTDFSEQRTGENMIFQVAPADNSDSLTTVLTLGYNSVSTFGGPVGIGVTPTQTLDVNGNGKFRGQDLLLGSSVDADNVIYIYSKNGAQSQIRTNAGVSGSYNGMMIASNYNQANSLPSWSLDLGGALNSTSNVNTFTVGYKAFGGAWSSLMTVNATGDTNISGNVTAPSAVFNNGTNSTNGIKIVSTTTTSVFTGGIEFIRTTVAGGSKVQPLRDAAIGGVGFDFLVTANNAAEIAATYTSAMKVLNNGNVGVGTTTSMTGRFTVQGTQAEIHVKNDDTRALTLGGWDGTRQYIKSINLGVALTPLTLQASSFTFDTGDVTIGNVLRVNAYGNVAGGTIRMGVVNNSVEKWSYLVSTQYNSSSNPQGFSVIGAYTTATANQVVIGGSIYEANPATEIQFWTHTATTHATGGTKRMVIDTNGVSNFYYGAIFNAPVSINGGAVPSDRWFEISGTTSGKVFGAVINPTFTYTGANIYGLYLNNNFGTGTITNSYALYIDSTSTGSATITNKYGLYQASSSDKNYFAGAVGIGTATSSYKLEVASDKSRFYNVAIGGTVGGTYAAYSDSVVGLDNLHLVATGSGAVYINTAIARPTYINPIGGNVGINTSSPTATLHVAGTLKVSDTLSWASGDGVNWYIQGQANGPTIRMKYDGGSTNRSGALGWVDNAGGRHETLTWQDQTAWFSGNVGIETSTPTTRLEVQATDGSGARTSPINVVTITADNSSNPYDGFGGGLLFKNRIYAGGPSPGGIRDGARIRTSINTNSSVNYGTDLVFDATSTGNGGLNEILRLSFNGVSTFTSSLRTNGVFSWNSGVGALSYNTGVVTMETNSATRIELKTNGTTALTLNTNQTARFANSLGIGRDATYNLDVNGSMRGSDRLYWNGTNQLVYVLNYQNLSTDGQVVTDTTANQGTAIRKPSSGFGSSTFFYGNYTSFPPGNYVAYFRLKVTSNASGSSLGILDVVGADIVSFAMNLRPNMFEASNTWQYIRLPFTITGGGYIEWRMVGFQTGITDLFLDHVMIYQEGGVGQVFARTAFSVYVNQGVLGMQLNTSGALTVTSSVTATSFFESSDFRLKSEIQDLDIDVSNITAKSYLKNGIREIGYIAQDVEGILPSAISKRDDGYLDLSYRQVHTAKIAALEKEVLYLKQQLKNK